MAAPDLPKIYLVTPAEFELSSFPGRLEDVLDAHEVACVRLALATRDEDRVGRAADALREVCHRADVALVIEEHVGLVERFGLDGVHLADGARAVRKARSALGRNAIVGAGCRASRHDGMTAGEAGADYVSFGPVTGGGLGDGTLADAGLFAWWSEMIELPVVAEGGVTRDVVQSLWSAVDFFALGEEIWAAEDAVRALTELKAAMR